MPERRIDSMSADAKIVFPTDFSELSLSSLPWVRRMAAVLEAEVHCIYAVEEPHVYATLDMGPVAMPSIEDLTQSAQARVNDFVHQHLAESGLSIVTQVLIGRPAEEIITYAAAIDADMIIMATHGYSGLKHALLGSTTEAVLRRSQCPVLSIPARH